MKFFSLISGKEVRLAPGQKRVPAKEFSTLKNAKEILSEVEMEVEELKKQSAIEAEEEKKRGYAQGFDEGLESFSKHLFALDQELKELKLEIQKKMLPLTLSAARKIIGEELKIHPDRIVDIVLTSLKPVTQHKKIIIYVNKADLAMLEAEKPKIKKIFEHLQSLSIQERDDIEPGGCIIETEAGIINAQLENQWRALESAFQSFMSK
jgi:type III secretion protein L